MSFLFLFAMSINSNLISKKTNQDDYLLVSFTSQELREENFGNKYFVITLFIRNFYEKEIISFDGQLRVYDNENENVIAKIDVSESIKLAKGEYKRIKIFKLFNPNEDELLSNIRKC